MVVILAVITFLAFVAIDSILAHRRRSELAKTGSSIQAAIAEEEPTFAAGYQLPESLHYHSGHAWVHWVHPELAYVGIDDFARRLVGTPGKVKAPRVGSYVRMGEAAVEMQLNEDMVDILSPISGEIVEINPELKNNPELAHDENYGRGWLFKVRAPHLFKELPNLMNGSLAQKWMEDTRDRFQHQLTLATGTVIQDGGTTVDDLHEALDSKTWNLLVDEFLLQTPRDR